MYKPHQTTPIPQLISLLGALPAWFSTHADALRDGLDAGWDGAAALQAGLDDLAQAQHTFEREQREDVAATIRADLLAAQASELLASVSKVAQAALREHPQRERVTRQILKAAPSTYRTPNQLIPALQLASAGLQQHADLFQSRAALHARLLDRAAALTEALQHIQGLRLQEHAESRAAQTARRAALQRALHLITTLDDGAQAVYFEAAEPYNTLRTLYAVHCPTTPRSNPPDEEDDAPLDPA